MNEGKNVITFKKSSIQKASQQSSVIRAKSFKVTAANQNYSQYINTIKAYALAGMPFEHIANAGEYIGDIVEKGEVDASLIEGWQGKLGEVAENESKLLAWQSRGETISITHQLSPPNPVTGVEIIPASQDLTTPTSNTEQTLNVVEGISVLREDTASLSNNPFLKAIPDLKKPF